ncbi:MAG: type II toxin-antitoxin system HicA family toxin [Candidatus Wildermuthbacteria bacterium]|nr:type II toxin-antitoxin system HicA family toxin [Candidatus Wildermuthbacteria bacterium]
MPRGLNNWTAEDVIRFLKKYGFQHTHSRGSHFYYTGIYAKKFHQVTVPFHGKQAIKPRTFKGIIAQSGIPKESWLEK